MIQLNKSNLLYSIVLLFLFISIFIEPNDAIKSLENTPTILVPTLSRIRVINTVIDLNQEENEKPTSVIDNKKDKSINHHHHNSHKNHHNHHNQLHKPTELTPTYGFDIIFNSSESMRIKGLSYLSMTDYITVPTGKLSINIVYQSTDIPISIDNGRDSFTLENDTDYTLIITGILHNTTSVTFLSDKDNNFGMDPSLQQNQHHQQQHQDNYNHQSQHHNQKQRTSLRFLQCTPQAGVVDFSIVGGATLFSSVEYLGTQTSPHASSSTSYISIPSNPYIFFVHQPENTSNIYIPGGDTSPLLQHSNSIVSILMVGIPGSDRLPLQLITIPYSLTGQSDQSIYQKQLPYTQYNSQLPSSPNTSASSSTLFKFSVAILSFLLLAGLSVI